MKATWKNDDIYQGKIGTVREVQREIEPGDPIEISAGLRWSIVDLRESAMPWHAYSCGLVHLRPIVGGSPARLQFPDATHEINGYALNPDFPIEQDGVLAWPLYFLQPINIAAQVHCCAAEQDEVLGWVFDTLMRGLADGELPIEPGGPFVSGIWQAAAHHFIDRNLEALGYPEGGHGD